MKFSMSKQTVFVLVVGLIASVLTGLGCSMLIHNAGDILRGAEGLLGEEAETFGMIFDQLKEAEVELPSLLLLVLCLLETLGVRRVICGKKGTLLSRKNRALRIAAIALPAILGVILIMLLTLWFTDVNGIRLGTVIRFLYSAVEHGVF